MRRSIPEGPLVAAHHPAMVIGRKPLGGDWRTGDVAAQALQLGALLGFAHRAGMQAESVHRGCEEVDAAISRKFAEKYGVLFKAAWFNADNTAPYDDTTKLWVQLRADF